ncbi:MAG: AI-2E family transporter [Lachnospiraceae bacterium]|jgi:predicted PurR-regulated permease PerM|nr:AI-2E family transporter [Lachnospiraceae bacterium]RKJ47719.1 AI-2E family transporter [bacterium 1XD42-54]
MNEKPQKNARDLTTDPLPRSKSQRFIKNNQYFTICIYAAVMMVICAIIFKCIIDIEKTKAWVGQILTMLSPFIFGALLAYVLNPMVHMFYRTIGRLCDRTRIRLKHKPHTIISILITYVIVISFVVLALVYVLPEIIQNIVDFVNYIPTAYNTLMDLLIQLQERFPSLDLNGIIKPVSDTVPQLINTLQSLAADMLPALYSLSVSIAGWIVNVFITIIVSIYMLYDKRRIMRVCWKMIYAFLPQKYIPLCKEIVAECNRLFSSFVVGKFIDSLIIGILCFVLMTIFRMPYTLFISLIVGVTNMIPYFGPFIGAIPGILIILFISPLRAVGFAILILALQQFDGLILGPKILGDSTGMKPLWIIFAISIGGSIAGVIGMFLGVPLVAFLSYLLDRYLDHRLRKKSITDAMIDGALKNLELDD